MDPIKIDRMTLAERMVLARRRYGMSQVQVAEALKDKGVKAEYITQMEGCKVAFRKEHHLKALKNVADYLKIDIPFISDRKTLKIKSFEDLKNLTSKNEENFPPQQEETSSDNTPKKGIDPELIAIHRCSIQLEKLRSADACARVLKYLKQRYVEDVEEG